MLRTEKMEEEKTKIEVEGRKAIKCRGELRASTPSHDRHSGFVQITVSCRIHFVDGSHHGNHSPYELSAFVHNIVFLWKHIVVFTEKKAATLVQ